MSTQTPGSYNPHPLSPALLCCVGHADMWGASTSLPLSPSRMGVSTGGHHGNESDPSLSAGERSWVAQPNASWGGGGLRWVQSIQATPLPENCIDFIMSWCFMLKYDQLFFAESIVTFLCSLSWLISVGVCKTKTRDESLIWHPFFYNVM